MSIVFAIEQAPDTEVNREFTAYAVKMIDGSRVINPKFFTLTSSSDGDQVTFQVSSSDNADSGLYKVGFEAVFENGKATKSCSVDLEIQKAKSSSWSWLSTEDSPKFDRKDVSKEKLKIEEDDNGIQNFTPIVFDCSQEW